jgi:hypothetical protein
VFRRDHHVESLSIRIDHLMAAVFIPEEVDRVARLAEHLADDFVYVGPEGVFDGASGLSEAFTPYRRAGGHRTTLRRTSPVEMHHGYFRFSWERVEDGVATMEGWAFGSLDPEGDTRRVVVFEGLVPGRDGRQADGRNGVSG